jgi:hypothetical protein
MPGLGVTEPATALFLRSKILFLETSCTPVVAKMPITAVAESALVAEKLLIVLPRMN